MKRTSLFLIVSFISCSYISAQQEVPTKESTDSIQNANYMDSIYHDLPELMVVGERPIVKAEQGKLVYDVPKLIGNLPVDNAYEAVKNLPGVVYMNDNFSLGGQGVTIIINGKVSTLSVDQLSALLKSMPADRIVKAEVMYAAPAYYQVRGAVINLILSSSMNQKPSFQGELYTSYGQKHYESLNERASLLYTGGKFSADFLYSYYYGRNWRETEKEGIHTLADGNKYNINMYESAKSRLNSHNIRFGTDYTFAEKHLLSLVYTTAFTDNKVHSFATGTQSSKTDSNGDTQLHNLKLDYQTPFGMKAGVEFTYYNAPGDQLLYSKLDNETLNFLSKDNQKINKWRFYAGEEQTVGKDWGINYGVVYTTTVDNSYQNYFDPTSGALLPDNNMKSRQREQLTNVYAGVSKSFGAKFSADISLSAEQYHTSIWNEWTLYPSANFTYTPKAGQIFQLSLSSDKDYPEYWSMQNTTSYISAYSEIIGNPLLKPASSYEATLSYILKGKYVFMAYYSHVKNKHLQTLYQLPDRLVEIYKYFNFDYSDQTGIVAVVPLKVKSWLDSRFTVIGLYQRQKDSDFWDIPFDRKLYSFVLRMSNTFTLSKKPDLKFTLSGFYQNRAIQGTFDLPRSGNLDAALRYTFANKKAQLTIKCDDIFNTSTISTRNNYKTQNVYNHYMITTREFGISFSYRFGGYKEKQREGVDTSRMK